MSLLKTGAAPLICMQERVSGDSSFGGGTLVTCRERVKLARAPSAAAQRQAPAFISCYPTRPLRRAACPFGGLRRRRKKRRGARAALCSSAVREQNIYLHAETKYNKLVSPQATAALSAASMNLCLVCD